MKAYGFDTGTIATRIAATVWGREEGEDTAFRFKQRDIDSILLVAAREGPIPDQYALDRVTCGAVLSLCVSDANKSMLLASDNDVIAVLTDNLLLDPNHPRRSDPKTDFEAVKHVVQQDSVEAIHQLAVSAIGREALLQSPRAAAVMDALHAVAASGWTTEARQFASGALVALSPRAAATHDDAAAARSSGARHVMVSYCWVHQAIIQRIVAELKRLGFLTWFDLDDMSDDIVSAMSDAVDNSEIMLVAISLACESAPPVHQLEGRTPGIIHQVCVTELTTGAESNACVCVWLYPIRAHR